MWAVSDFHLGVSQEDLKPDVQEDLVRKLWALGNPVELHLLALLAPDRLAVPSEPADVGGHKAKACGYAEQVVVAFPTRFKLKIVSVHRQLDRYVTFLPGPAGSRLNQLRRLAQRLCEILQPCSGIAIPTGTTDSTLADPPSHP